jgi:hypothetical protein
MFSRRRILMSWVSKGFNCLGAVVVLVRSGLPKLDGGEWKVAVGDTLRLCETALASRLGESGISWAGVVISALVFNCKDEE